ncbi:hypothetical protein P8452_57290 [Trifolium repens]|nr:hypothetical protein P8452_57290 [Trifolium repens]
MDGCTSLLTVHKSIGALSKRRFLSLRDCSNLVELPTSISTMSFLETLDLSGCFKLTTLPMQWTSCSHPASSSSRAARSSYQSRYLQFLIFIDVSFEYYGLIWVATGLALPFVLHLR